MSIPKPTTTSRLVNKAVVDLLDGINHVDAFLSRGPRPPRGRVAVVHQLSSKPVGPLGSPDRDLRLTIQVSSFGKEPEQALWVHDEVTDALLRADLTIDGGNHTLDVFRDGTSAGVIADEDMEAPIYFVPSKWVVETRPNE